MLYADPNLVAAHPNQKLMRQELRRKAFEGALADAEVELLRPARKARNHAATGTSNRFAGHLIYQ